MASTGCLVGYRKEVKQRFLLEGKLYVIINLFSVTSIIFEIKVVDIEYLLR